MKDLLNPKRPQTPGEIDVRGPLLPGFESILTTEALAFVADLERRFRGRRADLLGLRVERQAAFNQGELPSFLPETAGLRSENWRIAETPADLQDRRVEITGPVERKMVINALNSGARVFMADFEDSNSPTWSNLVSGQINLRDAVRRSIEFTAPNGKHYQLADHTATLMVRPRGWHLSERHLHVDGQPVSAGIFDFGLFFFHNAAALIAGGSGPYFYLPKLESHLEARLWNDIFVVAQEALNIPVGSIKATVLIETIVAAFEMDEILYELRDHSAGLNCGRWDYIFSFIKKFGARPEFLLPDRDQITMSRHFLRSYSQLLIQTCHRRGAHAMGGMAAQIPIKNDPEANTAAIAKVTADKEREAIDGHDGTWVAHPGLVKIAMDVFDKHMPRAHQFDRSPVVTVNAADLLTVPAGTITRDGLRRNLRIGIEYVAAWICGNGCVPLNNLMEDAATAEISRTQVWQWIRHGAVLSDGDTVTLEMALDILQEEISDITTRLGEERYREARFDHAAQLFERLISAEECAEFLTLPGYELLS